MDNRYLVGGIGVLALLALGVAVMKPPTMVVNNPAPVGAFPGNEITEPVEFRGGTQGSHYKSTSSPVTTYTAVRGDFGTADAFYNLVSYTPTVGDVTVTFPASSSLNTLVRRSGATSRQCWHNASTTAGIDITFAAGTGIDIQTSSSSITGGGPVLTLLSNQTGCFTYIRQADSDITVLYERFVAGD